MLCNNIGIKVSYLVNYRVCMVHSIAYRTFFLNYGTRQVLSYAMRFRTVACVNFMLVGINYVLPRYKADQQQPRVKNICFVPFQNKQVLFKSTAKLSIKM